MKMNEFFADTGFQSLTHYGEELCGDHVEIVQQGEPQDHNSKIIVLADGLGSGVKAGILAILTSKIISTMLAADLKLEDAVETIAATLPVSPEVNTAFSTFTIMHIVDNQRAQIIQYENPNIILLRDGKNYEIPSTAMQIGDKTILHSEIKLRENDIFFLMSDGVLYASENGVYNEEWDRDHIISYMETFFNIGFTAKTLTTILLEETKRLYGGKPTDDATVCTVRIRRRESVNLCFGPPSSYDDNRRMMALFFAREGKHIVCGGTTAKIAAGYLGKQITMSDLTPDPDIPPISEVDGIDLVTEGIITVNKVLEYAKDYLDENSSFEEWSYKKDGASLIARMLFETATDVNLFIGKAVNPAHQNMKFNFEVKMRLVSELTDCLKKMGKIVLVNYF
jgi:hypothetical protein